MPGTDLLLAFAAATFVFAVMPGPAILYTIAQTIARGRRAGLFAAAGIHLGGYVHVIAAALGLSALFLAVPTLYAVLKLAGAGYLIWLGIGLTRQSLAPDEAVDLSGLEPRSARRAFVDSVLVEVLNPKAALFFLAFLPQFVDPAASLPIWAQLLILGTVVNLAFSAADIVYILLAGTVVDRMRRSARLRRWTLRLGGGILAGLGAHLALNRT